MPPAADDPAISAPVLAQLLGLIAHDLRNPLGTIQSSTAFIREIAGGEGAPAQLAADTETQEAIEDILLSCSELAHTIDNFQILCHVLTGEPELEREPTPLRDVVVGVVAASEAAARSRSVHLKLSAGGAVLVRAHVGMLERALSNLIRNAITYAPTGSDIEIAIASSARLGTVRVADGGPALETELTGAAFAAAGQLSSKSRRAGRYSRGLGLFAAFAAARATGAALRATARQGGGGVFELELEAL